VDTWVYLSLVCALALATSDALTKKALAGGDEYLVAWFRLLFALPVLVVILFFVRVPAVDAMFYKAFAFSLPLEIIALNLHEMRNGFLSPFKAIGREKGSVLMIVVAFIYSITSSLGKMAIEHSSPLFFGATYFIVLTVLFSPVALIAGKDKEVFLKGERYKRLFFPGLFYSIMIVTHMLALGMANVAYMIAIKRASLIIAVIYGYFLFKEKNIRERLGGAVLMFAGFVMIVTA
jgi:drug/metabolite transporter (DMT)-like permease